MLAKLEADIAKVDEAIGEKLHVLDLDSVSDVHGHAWLARFDTSAHQ